MPQKLISLSNFCMDRPFPIKSTLLALLLALPVMAGERDERSMGDDAFSRGDYAGAVQFYSKALLYAKDKRWNEDALLLARAQLRAGDVAGAEKTYAEYRKRNPEGGNSAGMLPGELMLAAKNYSDAARYFSRLGETSPDPELQCSARFAAAAAFAEAGDFASAEAIYGEVIHQDGLTVNRLHNRSPNQLFASPRVTVAEYWRLLR